ncbi:MAG: hypothetical protein RhofKO_22910 [Rhodothermales bacterium]
MPRLLCLALALSFLGLGVALPSQAQSNDGTLFHQGLTQPRSSGAPKALDALSDLVGQWDVQFTTYPTDSTTVTQPAQAIITTMNRGHGYMERLHMDDYDGAGQARSTMTFLTFTPSISQWTMGAVDSFTESIQLFNGDLTDGALVMRDVQRRTGSTFLVHYRVTLTRHGRDHFTQALHTSIDHGKTWRPRLTKTYTRRAETADFMAGTSEVGRPADNLPDEARQFDFVLGDWSAQHTLTQPNGQSFGWTTNATASYALNGHAIIEYSWFNTDPNLPEAATTIVRIYNRAMKRWDCLYLNNRADSPLFFGGAQDGDEIVLHLFLTDSSSPISRFVFHDVKKDTYRWYSATSSDRGKTYTKTWTIDFTRND